MTEKPEHLQYIRKALETGITRKTLEEIYKICALRKSFCLVGFNDYSKHIINLLPNQTECIIDDDDDLLGIVFRNKKVVQSNIEFKSRVFVICKYDYLSEYTAKLKFSHPDRLIACPNQFENVNTRFANPFKHDLFLRNIFKNWDAAPNSMMSQNKIMFLAELFRSCSTLEGNVAEFGVWQGGSTLALMRANRFLNSKKYFLLFDFFESLDRKFKEAIMCNDEIVRKLKNEGQFRVIEGDMNETINLYQNEKFCFVHYDLGFHPKTLKYVLERTVEGGVIVFDNFGFATGSPALYQKFFQQFGQHVMSVPFSEQGVLIKRKVKVHDQALAIN